MTRTPFHDGWTAGFKLGPFESPAEGRGPVPVVLPHDALRDLPRSVDEVQGVHSGYTPGGAFEYARELDVPESWREKTVRLEFDGVYRDAVVFLNGEVVTHEANGYAGFTAELDPYLRFGETNRLTVEARAHRDSRWYSGAGIYRPVHLVVADPVHIPTYGVVVTTPDVDDERAVIEVAVTVRNAARHTRETRVRWEIVAPDGETVASGTSPVTVLPGTDAVARARLTVAAPARWHPDHPHLYAARTTVTDAAGAVLDGESTTFGIRTLQVDPVRGLRINGLPVTLRGACVHHDNGVLGAATHDDAEDRRVRLLKEAGFNALRSAHNPMSRAMLDACDRHGVLVMDELADAWTRAKVPFDATITFPERWERDIRSLVEKDRNHPSVIMYSIGNEILELGTPIGSTWSRRLAEAVRAADPTRFVTNGINGIIANLPRMAEAREQVEDANTMMANMGDQMGLMNASPLVSASIEESAAVLDVVGFNYADSRYRQDAVDHPNRVIVGSETFPARIDVMWGLVEELPHVIGDFTWTGWDYLGEAGIGRVDYTDEPGYADTGTAGPFPYRLAESGDLDITGYRRTISYYREIVYGLRTDPYIAVHRPQHHGRPTATTPWSWTDTVSTWSWDAAPGAPVTVDVYADADEVELLLDGESLGSAPVGAEKAFVARFETAFRPGELVAVARRDGRVTGRHVLRTAGTPRLQAHAERAEVAVGGLAFVTIILADDDGIAVADRDVPVEVAVSGPGVLAGLGSGRARTEESFGASAYATYDGRLLAVVRVDGPGEVVVNASAEGYDEVRTSVVGV
ncbi:glycoside hydrolase family 2 TIM barrel-domain containing protein [Microbacterium sp. KSW4-11]|uniref:Glycoside hydrolase family 2 TIM barrel-domain containing protein n=1 Tax=Microbacterium gawkjiense TaxID=3067309 RepID=A0ABU3GA01_9MICO|nr:glycoside hydrolase family 2 TIM barrel-domain containing protein [Microbacterium sp. KSW4-11]MDT3316623.1 glycoside hydrolase family 2 TIM barrel-domain containing protein [Microbacterium sp. KSW4-11]